jgi:multicomponent Na+:H+ antiporter subunit E
VNKNVNFVKLLLLFIFLLMFWFLLAIKWELQTLAIGSVICLVIVIYNKSTFLSNDDRLMFSVKKFFYFLHYIARLFVDIVKANIDVALIVLSPKLPISPSVVSVPCTLKKDVSKTIFCNSITLTPGTLTLMIQGQNILVHCLTEEAKQGVVNWDMESIIAKLEEE